jgi:hypothetical protein
MSRHRDADRASELSALVDATSAEDVTTLEAVARELRQLRDRLAEVDDISAWTPAAYDGLTAACTKLGQVRGRHYLDWLPQLDAWRREKSDSADDASLELLTEILDAVEREGRVQGWALPRNYYERIAIIQARRGEYAQVVAVCDRYEQRTPPGTGGALQARLTVARERLASRSGG